MKNWLICGVLLIIMLCAWAFLPPPIYLIGAFMLFFIGYSEYQNSGSPRGAVQAIQNTSQAPAQSGAATAQVILPEREMPENIPADLKCPSCGASIKPTDRQCNYCSSNLQPLLELPEPAKLAALEIGKTVRVIHPQKGEQTYQVRGRLLYTELWQASRGPNIPWTPTGNYYAGFALEPDAYLLNWQERFYLLETRRALTDMDINRDFMPYAKQFAQSNQTARVQFSYDGAHWLMVDIGRFAIEFEEGEGLHLRKGAIGRFIHSKSENQALVLDDFQSGGSGGQDTLWRGWQINENEIHF
ncbi:MAG: hypothetical protein CVU44_12330 [Chloroflexi bacterium HGW-Chloroflexi-6]|nr:MAG: hypothetical protein CVU44_12330 [Chloroflexi bacterium HGW-Chloroflexi-6]